MQKKNWLGGIDKRSQSDHQLQDLGSQFPSPDEDERPEGVGYLGTATLKKDHYLTCFGSGRVVLGLPCPVSNRHHAEQYCQ